MSRGASTDNDKTGSSSLQGVLGDIRKEEAGGAVSVDEILDALEHRSFGPLLLIPGLLSIMPVIGALPGVSYTMAVLALLISVQFALSKPKLWLPGFLKRRSFDRDSFDKGLKKARPVVKWIDRLLIPRFQLAFRSPMPRVIAGLCVAVSALMFVYASVPGGIVFPGVALVLLGLGLTTQDGLVTALGVLAAIGVIAGTYWAMMWAI